MNIFSHLPLFGKDRLFGDIKDDDAERAEAKKERIEFHRAKVRNGPVNFKTPTNGQLRRAEKRARDRAAARAYRKQKRAYFDARRETAVLRGHLESVGLMQEVLQRPGDWAINDYSAYRSSLWLIKHFADRSQVDPRGRVILTEDLVIDSFRSALNRWQQLVGLPAMDLPTGYELPVPVVA